MYNTTYLLANATKGLFYGLSRVKQQTRPSWHVPRPHEVHGGIHLVSGNPNPKKGDLHG